MQIDNDQKYQELKKEISEYLSLPSTQNKLSECKDRNQAIFYLKKHLLQLLRVDIDSIHKALDELIPSDPDRRKK
jgi:hypothetical protein